MEVEPLSSMVEEGGVGGRLVRRGQISQSCSESQGVRGIRMLIGLSCWQGLAGNQDELISE